MTHGRTDVDGRVEAYLDGALPSLEAAAFERELASRPELAAALVEAVAVRDLLGGLPPAQPPAGLEARIAAALRLDGGAPREAPERGAAAPRSSVLATVRAALAGGSWLVRPPAAVVVAGAGGARPIALGLAQLKWALGPLAPGRSEAVTPRPVWRRVVGGLGRLGGLR
jgi:anti-sigma factor RsiW